jgi:hypothetical protein
VLQIETLISHALPGRAYAAADASSWSAQGGTDVRYVHGRHPIDLEFHDPLSVRGARVSLAAWSVWLGAMLAFLRRYSVRSGAAPACARPYSAYLRPPGTDQ